MKRENEIIIATKYIESMKKNCAGKIKAKYGYAGKSGHRKFARVCAIALLNFKNTDARTVVTDNIYDVYLSGCNNKPLLTKPEFGHVYFLMVIEEVIEKQGSKIPTGKNLEIDYWDGLNNGMKDGYYIGYYTQNEGVELVSDEPCLLTMSQMEEFEIDITRLFGKLPIYLCV